jgi:acetoacetate decarboxylase
MARLRYVQDLTPKSDTPSKASASQITHTVQSIRALYETEPEIAKALLPRPLSAAERPEIFVQFANIAMHLSPERTVRIGAATVGVACTHEGRAGYYVLAMPMEGEFVVIGGREKYGEPKKMAQTAFELTDERVMGSVTRHGVAFLELRGKLGAAADSPKQFTEHFYCYKALPTCTPEGNQNGGFDGEVLLTQLNWERNYTSVRTLEEGEIILRESPHDPLIDVPVKRLVRMEFAEGASKTGGEVLRSVPGEWLAPFLSQRYDVPQPGVEIALASETEAAQ